MTTRTALTPTLRLQRLARRELAELANELGRARNGKDGAVHRARKSIQRLRALLRLLAAAHPEFAARQDARLKRLRRRLGPLRDAAVRLEQVEALRGRALDAPTHERLEAAIDHLRAELHDRWELVPRDGEFWQLVARELLHLQRRLPEWPADGLDQAQLDAAVERARKRLRRAIVDHIGHCERTRRHELRRRLRRYASMRRAAAQVGGHRDPIVARVTDLARELGVEGDLWLASTALRSAGHPSDTRALRRALETERRALCRHNDGELVTLRRTVLKRPRARADHA